MTNLKQPVKELTAHDRFQERQRIAQKQHIQRANMKIYCELCDKVQPVQIDNCVDVETKKLYQDIVCGECNLVIASGTDIAPPKREWVGLTDQEMSDTVADIDVNFGDLLWKVVCLTKIIEAKLKEKNT